VASKILNLIGPILDPTIRMNIASTIHFLFGMYCDGKASDEEIRGDLREICMDVLTVIYPEWDIEELRKRADILVDEFMSAFRLESVVRRMFGRRRWMATPP